MVEQSAVLSQSVAQTLEELCFHFAEPCERSERRDLAFARVGFDGHWGGELVVGLDPALLGQLTESVLGEDAIGAEDTSLALLEIANVICGNALPRVESSSVEFALEAPVACGRELFDRASMPPVAEAFLDDGAIMVRMFRRPSSR